MSKAASLLTPDAPIRPLQPEEFRRFRTLLYDNFGVDLREGKEELVSARLSKKVRELGLTSFSQYFELVTSGRESYALPERVDLLPTNNATFFRESVQFDFMRRALRELKLAKAPVRIWSAACSTVEEPYSVAVAALEDLAPGAFEVIATDVSTRVLKAATTGSLNLVDNYSHPAPFSMIWCRNVMIYFDKPTQERFVRPLSEWLKPGGYLFINHSEAVNGIRQSLRYTQPAVYRKP
jgi:chemotaxis protein methyltransferase CheR